MVFMGFLAFSSRVIRFIWRSCVFLSFMRLRFWIILIPLFYTSARWPWEMFSYIKSECESCTSAHNLTAQRSRGEERSFWGYVVVLSSCCYTSLLAGECGNGFS